MAPPHSSNKAPPQGPRSLHDEETRTFDVTSLPLLESDDSAVTELPSQASGQHRMDTTKAHWDETTTEAQSPAEGEAATAVSFGDGESTVEVSMDALSEEIRSFVRPAADRDKEVTVARARPASGQYPSAARPVSGQHPSGVRPVSGQHPGVRPVSGQHATATRPVSGMWDDKTRMDPGPMARATEPQVPASWTDKTKVVSPVGSQRSSPGDPDITSVRPVGTPGRSESGINRRTSRRVPVVAKATRYDGAPVEWSSVNLSERGVLLSGPDVLPKGKEFELGLWLPDGGTNIEIVCTVRVAWMNEAGNDDEDGGSSMGVEFVSMQNADREILRQYLTRASDAAPRDDAQLATTVGGGGEARADALEREASGVGDPDSPAPPGTVFGSYRVIKVLGSGGMGHVYLVEHMRLGRRLALKRLHSRYSANRQLVQRFLDEARGISRINHENIVAITDFIAEGNDNCYVMEMLEGGNLARELVGAKRLAPARVARIASQVCRALQSVHDAGIVHRDLKPENVFITRREGQEDLVKLLDFGIAKFLIDADERVKTSADLTLGTPGYIAPEYLLHRQVDYRADIYALGVLMFEMVTGRKPFVADTWPKLVIMQAQQATPHPSRYAEVPALLEQLIMDCLEKDPDKRPQSARQIEERLQPLLSPAAGKSVSLRENPAYQQKKLLIAAGGVLLVFVILLVILLLLSGGEPETEPAPDPSGTEATAPGATRPAELAPASGPNGVASPSSTAPAAVPATATMPATIAPAPAATPTSTAGPTPPTAVTGPATATTPPKAPGTDVRPTEPKKETGTASSKPPSPKPPSPKPPRKTKPAPSSPSKKPPPSSGGAGAFFDGLE